MDSNPEIEYYIGRNTPWSKLPTKVKEIFGNSHKGYEKAIVSYSIRNQVRFSSNIVKTIRKDEGKYYEELVNYSKEHLMLYPYHLADKIVKGLRITPFQYYSAVFERIMEQEKSYDSLPNFTAADGLRLLGIGRNQYIDLMNQRRSSRKFFKRPPKDLLPPKPVDITIEPWFLIQVGFITESDIGLCKAPEKEMIDFLIDNGQKIAGNLNREVVQSLYRKGLIYLDVPIHNEDYIIIPPLEGFVMNRVLGDYFETLLYKIFVSIDEHTTVEALATILDINVELIKSATSLYCRLGFAYKKNLELDYNALDPSWADYQTPFKQRNAIIPNDDLIADLTSALSESSIDISKSPEPDSSLLTSSPSIGNIGQISKRIAFLYDSTLTAFLMMGNLSPGLKNHAVTMFEVGKMSDESLDSFLAELNLISWSEGEGEAQRYFEHAKTLQSTIHFLRNNPRLGGMSLDLLRCESLLNLDPSACSRLLNKNYELLVSMAPLSYEVKAICCSNLSHFGPPISQINSIWFKLFLYEFTKSGPPSLLLPRGTMLSQLPAELEDCEFFLVTSWGHDSGVIPGSNALFTLNEALGHSPVFVQAYGLKGESSTVIVPFPFAKKGSPNNNNGEGPSSLFLKWETHPAVLNLRRIIDPENNCGYITMINNIGSSSGGTGHSNDSSVMAPGAPSLLPNLQEEVEVVEDEEEEEKDESISEEDLFCITSNHSNSSTANLQINYPSSEDSEPPKNGFRDDSAAKLYQEELEEEFKGNQFPKIVEEAPETQEPRKPKEFDMRQQKIESLRLDLNLSSGPSDSQLPLKQNKIALEVSNKNWFEEWDILDCQFGIPLFDAKVNEIVCERMVENGLWDKESLEYLIKSNEELAKLLIEFIAKYQTPNMWSEEIPLPTSCLYFNKGVLEKFLP